MPPSKTIFRSTTYAVALLSLSLLFVAAGINHFVNTQVYISIMPSYLPMHHELILISGAFEIIGGLGILLPMLRKAAGWGLMALLLAVFPANLQMSMHTSEYPSIPAWLIHLRLPFQLLFFAWVYWTTIYSPNSQRKQKPRSG